MKPVTYAELTAQTCEHLLQTRRLLSALSPPAAGGLDALYLRIKALGALDLWAVLTESTPDDLDERRDWRADYARLNAVVTEILATSRPRAGRCENSRLDTTPESRQGEMTVKHEQTETALAVEGR